VCREDSSMRRKLACLAVLFGLATLNGTLHAQSRTGTIFGVVRDATGGVLPGAAITATEEATTVSRETISDGSGRFEFALLPIGRYLVKVSLSGFSDAAAPG